MLTSSISNTYWCHSGGEPCNFMDSLYLILIMADVIAIDFFGSFCCYWQMLLPYCHYVATCVLMLADVIAMLLYDFLIDGDVITIRLML